MDTNTTTTQGAVNPPLIEPSTPAPLPKGADALELARSLPYHSQSEVAWVGPEGSVNVADEHMDANTTTTQGAVNPPPIEPSTPAPLPKGADALELARSLPYHSQSKVAWVGPEGSVNVAIGLNQFDSVAKIGSLLSAGIDNVTVEPCAMGVLEPAAY